ncbi:MAG: gamma-glutamylcyclotransferase [Chitinivibrionales bacterium]|nr:gamma-glutamylcyclotransferase [Chitinivibrionales bacterium]
MVDRLFAYGTLMCDDIMHAVVGESCQCRNALLRGYRRRFVAGEEYPAITGDATEDVRGVLYEPISASAWSRLDRFEGELYRRTTVTVELDNNATQAAQTYVIRDEHLAQLSSRPWSLECFMQRGKRRFESFYLGFDALRDTP